MCYVYILLSLKDKRFYIGSTGDLIQREKDHDNGKVKSTCHRRPLKLICYECYPTKKEALRREKYLKSNDGRKEIRIRLSITLSKYLG
jgi:putative endonuclease